MNDVAPAMSGSTVLALSLFIILLAFFIVLNALSYFVEEKVDAAFDSLDLTFSTYIPETFEQKEIMAENQPDEGGEGDSLEDVQSTLRAVLPGLNVRLNETPNGGQTMAVRIPKDQFEKLSKNLIPVFVRILNLKDDDGVYYLSLSSYVRDPLSDQARRSFNIINAYKNTIIEKGLSPNRIKLSIEKGNPAFLSFHFYKGEAL